MRSRSVHNFSTCEKRTAAQCQMPIFPASNTRFFSKVAKLCTDLDLSLLYTYSKFARKNNVLALGVCFPQPCSSAGRRDNVVYWKTKRKISDDLQLAADFHVYKTTDESFRFHSQKFDEMRCKLDSTGIRILSRNTQPHLNVI